ncbi:GGDEF domain-containing protein [Herminiimonas arsenitoxidans]|uniref:GGDEF domain-containing protein n=1 Tax=Herminiimonas arsenitoxidans TaxID=1809410 RepID=UPI000970A61A|nr:GGDEF domain-containing protein [Herminiimonas arsenitoxidans]
MSDTDLFEAETAALNSAYDVITKDGASGDECKAALDNLAKSFHRLMRETRRLIARSDRKELELNTLNFKLQQLTSELDYKARHDNLTGVLNRGAVFDRAEHYLKTSTLALIVLDIDFFKRINDEFGHPTGDSVLRELVQKLKSSLNGIGEIGRVGGEEFTVLLPNHNSSEAIIIAEDIRREIADKAFSSLPNIHVTASFGVSWSDTNCDFEDAYGRADVALYKAKHNGRNRVEFDLSTGYSTILQPHDLMTQTSTVLI